MMLEEDLDELHHQIEKLIEENQQVMDRIADDELSRELDRVDLDI